MDALSTTEEVEAKETATDLIEASELHLGKRILSGGTIYGLTNFGLKGLNFLLLPIFSRYLQPSDFGVVALAESIAAPIGMICGLGTATSLRRLYYDYGNDPSARHIYLGTAIRFAAVSAIVIIGLCFFIGPSLLSQIDQKFSLPFFPLIAVAIASAGLAQVEQTQLSIFQVENRPVFFALTSLGTFGLAVILVPGLVIWFHLGAAGVLTSRLIGVICGVLATAYLSRSLITAPWDWQGLREQLRLGLPITVFEVVNLALIFADRVVLQHYRPLSEVGVYSLAYSFGSLMLLLTGSLSQVWSPLFFESACAGQFETLRNVSSSLMASLVAIACVGVLVARPVIHMFLDARYAAAAALVPIIIGAYLLNSFYYLLELQAFQQKRTSVVAGVTVFACALNIALNVWMVPRIGVFGAAFATMASYLAQAVTMYLFVRRQIKHLYSLRMMGAYLGIFCAVLAAVEIPWPASVRTCVAAGTVLLALLILWPLGLCRLANIARSAEA